MIIINDLPQDMRKMAMLKFYVLRIQNDDLIKISRDSELIDKIIYQGFEEIFVNKKVKTQKTKNDKPTKKKLKSKKKKQDEDEDKNAEYDQDKREIAVNSTIEELNLKLYGLIVPMAGNFLPDFFDMIKLMTLRN
jgi:hypothetical protein